MVESNNTSGKQPARQFYPSTDASSNLSRYQENLQGSMQSLRQKAMTDYK